MSDRHRVKNLYVNDVPLKDKYEQKEGEDSIFHPARIEIVGPPGTGKTNLAVNLAMDHLVFDTVTVFAKNPYQHCFENVLRPAVEEAIEEAGGDLATQWHVSNEIDRDPQSYDPNLQHLVIIDDLTHKTDTKNGNKAAAFFKYGRPQNISVIVITQGFFNTNKEVRENANYYLCFKGRDVRDIDMVRKYYAPDLDKDHFFDIYNKAVTREDRADFNAFLTIVVDEVKPELKYRRALVPNSLIRPDEPAPQPHLKVKTWSGGNSSHGSSYDRTAATKVAAAKVADKQVKLSPLAAMLNKLKV